MSEWIRLIDGLPGYGELVLVQLRENFDGRSRRAIAYRSHTDKEGEHWKLDALPYMCSTRVESEPHVLYWMPLP